MNNKAELILDGYVMENFKYFLIAVPKRYIDNKKLYYSITSSLDNINTRRIY